ncbi:MAG: metallophosphoesterase [Verrucomicrobia bacterium]|nr:metallophosphoesterase [Verrucomicrobiota bacterium]
MNNQPAHQTSRRDWLRRSAGTLLALGAWPGCARWSSNGRGGDFSFVVLNDTHFQSPECPEWFARVRASLRTHQPRPEFCLMVGDLAEHGTAAELGGMHDVLRSMPMPFHAIIGNHDYVSDTDRSVWDKLFPRSLNYEFVHRGWRFIGLDSSEGTKYNQTRIQPATLGWLDDRLPKLDRATPTVVFTHFPLGAGVRYRPVNADDLLARLLDFNLVAVFNGHFHGFTERRSGPATLTTNRCCSISRGNHDGTTEKGYFLCTAQAGVIQREFVEVKPA